MFFGILLTPKQYFAGIIGAVVGLILLAMLLAFSFSGAGSGIPTALKRAVKTQESLATKLESKTRAGKAAISGVNISSIRITPPPDLRLSMSGKLTVRNPTDQEAIGALVKVTVRSDTITDHYFETELSRDFKPPLSPGQSREIEFSVNAITTVALSSERVDPVSHADLAGQHAVSQTDIELTAIKVPGTTSEKFISIGPTDQERAELNLAEEVLNECSALLKILKDEGSEKFEFSQEQLSQNSKCMASLPRGLASPLG